MIEKNRPEADTITGPEALRAMSAAQFAALGANAVAFVRPVAGHALTEMIEGASFDDETLYHLVMSADGTPLMVADSAEAVREWLAARPLGLASLH